MHLAIFSLHTCPLASVEGKETGGLNVYVLETSKELGKMGIKVDMFTRSQNAREPHIVQVSPNVRLIHLVVGPEKPISKKLLFPYLDAFVKGFFKFSATNNFKYDILHSHYYLSGLAGIKVAEKLNIPHIVSFHTLALMKNLVGRTTDEKEQSNRIDAEFELVKNSDSIVASSENDKAYLKYLYDCPPENIHIASPGVDTGLFYPISKKKAKDALGVAYGVNIILAVGRIEPLKGFDALLYALKILLVKKPEFSQKLTLWIVGGDTSEPVSLWSDELKHLEKLQRELGLSASVKFVGKKTQVELRSYYSSADLVVMPSHYESFGMVALEAIACGVPVIISNVSGVSDLVNFHRAGLVTTVNNPLLLARQMEDLLSKTPDEDAIKKIENRAKKFTWTKTAKTLMDVYKQVGKIK